MHFFAPVDLPPLPKHVIFVLDVSGSMSGRKLRQLKEAMATILDDLNRGDLFSIVVFSEKVEVRTEKPAQPIHKYVHRLYEVRTTDLMSNSRCGILPWARPKCKII